MNEQPVSHGEAIACDSTVDEVRPLSNFTVEVSSECSKLYFAMAAKVQLEAHQLKLVFSEDKILRKQLGKAYELCHNEDEIIKLEIGDCKWIWVSVCSDSQGKYIILQRNSPINDAWFPDSPRVLKETFHIWVVRKPPSSLAGLSGYPDEKLHKVPWCIGLPKAYGEGVLAVKLPTKVSSWDSLSFKVKVGHPEQAHASPSTATDGPEEADSVCRFICSDKQFRRVMDRLSQRFDGICMCCSLATHLELRENFVSDFRLRKSAEQNNYPYIAMAIMEEWVKAKRVEPSKRLGALCKVLQDDLERDDLSEKCSKWGKDYSGATAS